MNLLNLIKNILAPKKCYSCKKEWLFLCEKCEKRLPNFPSSCFVCKQESENYIIHKNCKKNTIYYDKIIIKYHYKGTYIKKMIHDGKFYGRKDIFEEIWQLLSLHLETNEKCNKNSILVPVPLHFLRRMKRGFNQSEILAREISAYTWIWYHNNILKRKKHTRQQSKLSRKIRLTNIEDGFAINKNYMDTIDKKDIIIVDDIVSTASTINEVSRMYKMLGAKRVIALCVASD